MSDAREPNGRWRKGVSGYAGHKTKLGEMSKFDVVQAARRYCPRAIEVAAQCLEHKDARIRLMAAELLLSRGFGKPQQQLDAEVVHRFVQAPPTLDLETWLRTRGQGDGVAEPKRLCRDAISEANTIDLKVADDKPN